MTEARRLDLPAEWTGHWWLPADPEKIVPGILRYKPDEGLSLSMIGGFEDRILRPVENGVAVMEGSNSWPLIWGLADNKEITLIDCQPTHSQSYGVRIDGPHKQTVSAKTALVGTHLKDAEQPVFTECQVSVENLLRWSNSSVLTGTYDLKDKRFDGKGSLFVKPVVEPSVVVNRTTISLAHRHTLPHFDALRGETVGRMRDAAFVRFRTDTPHSLSTAREHAKAIQDLISLATHRASGLLWLTLRMPSKNRTSPEHEIEDHNVEVFSNTNWLGDFDSQAVDHRNVLFTCQHIPFEEIIPRWLDVRTTLQAASNMVLGLQYAPAMFIESNVLTAVSAAEVMHLDLNIDEKRISPEEFKTLRAALLEETPKRHRGWVKGALRNAVSLKQRLEALADLPDTEAMQRLVPNVEQWAKTATAARNALAHRGQTPHLSMDELITTMRVTSAVVVMNLLQELGLPGERQKQIVNDNPELRQTAIQAGRHLT